MRAGSNSLDPALIGQRLTLRLKDPEGGYRDLVGVLESEKTLRKKSGDVVEFDPQLIALVHPIVERKKGAGTGAPLSLRIAELENLSSRTWPARRIEDLGTWQIRISDGVTYRANSVLVQGSRPWGEPGLDIEEAINRVEEIYSKAQLPAVFHCPLPLYQELKDYLIDKGWKEKVGAAFLISDIQSVEDLNPRLQEKKVNLVCESSPTAEFLALHGDEILEPIMKAYPAHYVSLRINGEIIATARLAILDSWSILTRLFVAASHRRFGLAELLMKACTNISLVNGADKISLQLDQSNLAAQALYEKLGFRIHHTYSFIERQESSECAC
ncbi:MAG: GNAT family N-acetyltransferase [Candidatus Planktophila sp.]